MDTARLLQLANARKDSETVILVFSDHRYTEVLLNWLVGLNRLGIRNYLIVSLDEEIHAFLEERGFPTFLSPLEGTLGDLWALRMNIFRTLCANKIDFIHSDADAIWLKNPIPEYFNGSGHHIVASQGTIWPPDVLSAQGFVFCCGFFYIKSCPQTLALLDDINLDVKKSGDDQVSFNRSTINCDIAWETESKHSYTLTYENQKFLCFKDMISGQSGDQQLSFALLPHHLFQRLHMPGHDAFLKHLLSDKNSESKLDMFSQTNCLFLTTDWKDRNFTAATLENIDVDTQQEAQSGKHTRSIKTLCIALGPYRNLTTLTAGVLSLHPNCQVLNHGGVNILPDPSLNFLEQYSEERFDNFVDFAFSMSADGERGDAGGSILYSHAYDAQHRLGSLYSDRYGQKKTKDSVYSIFWKESLMVSNYIREHQVDLDQLITKNDRLRFLMPVRNPLDCAASNLKTGHADRFTTCERNIQGILKAILEELLWFVEISERHPYKFFYYYQNEFNEGTLNQLARFLNIEDDDRWIEDALHAFEIKRSYQHETALVKFYREQVSRLFSSHPNVEHKLLSFVDENNNQAAFPSIIVPSKKKILVYGLQSSGASLFSYFLSQREGCLGLMDLNNHRLAPSLNDNFDIVLKAVVTTRWSLQAHIDSFKPDKTILFVRDPYSNYFSLMQKPYAGKSGSIDTKFRLMNSYFEMRDQFDATIYYEDFITDHSGTITKLTTIGWEDIQQYYRFRRTPQDIAQFNVENCIWCKENPAAEGPAGGWGMGNIHSSTIDLSLSEKPFDSVINEKVKALCPTVYEYYLEHIRSGYPQKPPLSASGG